MVHVAMRIGGIAGTDFGEQFLSTEELVCMKKLMPITLKGISRQEEPTKSLSPPPPDRRTPTHSQPSAQSNNGALNQTL